MSVLIKTPCVPLLCEEKCETLIYNVGICNAQSPQDSFPQKEKTCK